MVYEARPADLNVARVSLRRRIGKFGERMGPYAFLLPALVFYVVFMAMPLLGTLAISLLKWSGLSLSHFSWAGLTNYINMATDPIFWGALKDNVLFVLIAGSLEVILGLFLAILLERGLFGSNFFRGVFFVPTVMSLVVVGILFTLILSPELGLVNPMLKAIGLGRYAHAWLGEPGTALMTVMGADVWKNFGFSMFLFVAGLKGIDQELYQAAKIDGANAWQSLWRITLPVLRSVTITVVVLVSIGTLKLFDLVYVMTSAGPNHASEVLATWMYSQGFMFNNMGYGSSIAIVLLLITFSMAVVQLKVLSKENQ